jgi:uncharacterized protein (DUF2235 family)
VRNSGQHPSFAGQLQGSYRTKGLLRRKTGQQIKIKREKYRQKEDIEKKEKKKYTSFKP